MSYNFSVQSQSHLNSCDERLIDLMNHVIKDVDCTILEGHRNQDRQDSLYAQGLSRVAYPGSLHNVYPSRAVDVIKYPIDWNDALGHVYFGGYVLGLASQLGIGLRWGGDWNKNHRFCDQTFHDRVHFELVD